MQRGYNIILYGFCPVYTVQSPHSSGCRQRVFHRILMLGLDCMTIYRRLWVRKLKCWRCILSVLKHLMRDYWYKRSDVSPSWHICVNFKELKTVTVIDPQPMMSPDDCFPNCQEVGFTAHFLISIPMEENQAITLTSFVTSRGLMRFEVMPFWNFGKILYTNASAGELGKRAAEG